MTRLEKSPEKQQEASASIGGGLCARKVFYVFCISSVLSPSRIKMGGIGRAVVAVVVGVVMGNGVVVVVASPKKDGQVGTGTG